MSESSAGKCDVSLNVNGRDVKLRVYPMERLLDVLRNELGLMGTKEGCGEGECGSCSILMDGGLVNSCLIPVLQADDSTIITIEGLAPDGRLSALQKAFLDCGGAQCGICTPGMLVAAHHLLSKQPNPSLDEVREGLSGNLCRCTGYVQIFEAVMEAVRQEGAS